MKTLKAEVKTTRQQADGSEKREVVAIVDIQEFASLDEALSFFTEQNGGNADAAQSKVLGLVNTQHATNLKNDARQSATARPTKAVLRTKAVNRIFANPSLVASVAGDEARIQALIESTMLEIEKEMEAQKAQSGQAPTSEDDE